MIDEATVNGEPIEENENGLCDDTAAKECPDGSTEENGEGASLPTVDAPEENENADRLDELCRRQSIDAEYLEFARLFPDVNIATLPDSVCDSVRSGVPLAAAYALYEKKRSLESTLAENANEKNASMSFRLNENSSEKYFSPDEVKSMSRDEVRTNYKRIIESMRHWR